MTDDETTRPLELAPRPSKPPPKRGSIEARLDALEAEHEALGRQFERSLADLRAFRKQLEEKNLAKRTTGDIERRRASQPASEDEDG